MKEVKFIEKTLPAAPWKRTLAYLLDLLLIDFVILFPFRSQLENTDYTTFLSLQSQPNNLIFLTIIITALTLFYFTVLEYKVKQTFGKMLFNIYVTSKQGSLTLKQTLLRNITKPFFLVFLVDCIYMIFTRTNQRLFEKFSNTEVNEVQWKLK